MADEQPEIFKNLRQRLQDMPVLTNLKGRAQEVRSRFQDRSGAEGKGVLQREGVGLKKVFKEHTSRIRKDGVSDPVERMTIPGKVVPDPVIKEHTFKLTKG